MMGTSTISYLLHRHLLKLVILSYGLAAAYPALGLWIKDAEIGRMNMPGGLVSITLPKMLLALLLFNAGIRVRVRRIGDVVRRPVVILAGLATNVAVPFVLLAVLAPVLGTWHNPEEAGVVLLGLALVTSMPIAGSSTGWAHAADGDMALSLGLVVGSTLLSPLTAPASLHALGWLAPGVHGDDLRRLAGSQTGAFLSGWVLLPAALGILARCGLGDDHARSFERLLKSIVPATLLLLCYANASSCLPVALVRPDWDFFAIILVLVVGLCVLTFTAGYVLGRLLGTDRPQRAALLFGLGMNNNGTGLVLASVALGARPMVMLPIIMYNLTQHLVAGCVDAWLRTMDEHGASGSGGQSWSRTRC
jgi:BASS family bile acid:Na+ symporter